MSTEKNAEAFVKRLASDTTLQERFQNGDGNAILAWAKSEGYEFGVAELEAALVALAPQDKELSEEQLGKVNGGFLDFLASMFTPLERRGGAIYK